MIVRIWRATATHDMAVAYQRHFENHVMPHLKTIGGFSGASLLRRHVDCYIELLVTTRWQSLESICAFTGPNPNEAIVDADARALLTTFETTAGNYEMVAEYYEMVAEYGNGVG